MLSSCVAVVIGTRPEAIKLAPVAAALERQAVEPLLIFTGQHPLLDPADYGLHLHAAVHLQCPGQADPHAHVGMVSAAVAAVVAESAPALVMVQGDTSSALGGALAARCAGIRVAHVEAGLRSHDLRRPWPEEEFRVAIDAGADLLFAPTELSAANLRREGVRGQIHVTGNSGIDAVLGVRRSVAAPVPDSCGLKRLLVTCHRRENWGGGLDGVAAALRAIAAEGMARVDVILHPNPALAARVRKILAGHRNIAFSPPCGHQESVAAMLSADLVLSDSGGMQEEAAALGVPLLVLRDTTERPEGIACGAIALVGTGPGEIVAAVRRRLARPAAKSALPFGDGRSGERIAAIVSEWLGHRELNEASPISTARPRHAGNW